MILFTPCAPPGSAVVVRHPSFKCSFFSLYLENFTYCILIQLSWGFTLILILDASQVIMKENDAEVALRALESTLLEVISQTTKEEQEYQAKQKIYENVSWESDPRMPRFLHSLYFLIFYSFSS